jgi:hypothetical protein
LNIVVSTDSRLMALVMSLPATLFGPLCGWDERFQDGLAD